MSVSVAKSAWIVRVPKESGAECEVTIPIDWCYEWFASLKKDGKEVWSDQMEHYGSPDEELDAAMADAILSYVTRVAQSDLASPVSLYEERA